MKKFFKWTGIVLLSPVLLFLILAALLYVPPIQQWLAGQVAAYASEQTGLTITVEHVNLSFPLDLGIDGILVVRENATAGNDTIAQMGHAVADVQLWPLTKGEVVLNELQLSDMRLNTADLIGDMRLKGVIGDLKVAPASSAAADDGVAGINLSMATATLGRPQLRDADLTIWLSDTAAVDTTESAPWRIAFEQFDIQRSRLTLVIDSAAIFSPAATTTISLGVEQATLDRGKLDLGQGSYSLGPIAVKDGELKFNDISASNLQLGLDSLHYGEDYLQASLAHASGTVRGTPSANTTGDVQNASSPTAAGQGAWQLELTALEGRLKMENDRLLVSDFNASTPHSSLSAQADVDLSILDSLGTSPGAPGRMNIDMHATVGRADLMQFVDVPSLLLPNEQLTLRTKVSGTTQHMQVEQLRLTLPSAFSIEGSGTATNVNSMDRLLAQLDLRAQTYGALTPLLHQVGLPADYRLPAGISLTGRVEADGSRYMANLLANVPSSSGTPARALVKGWFDQREQSYEGDIKLHHVDIRTFMPRDSIGPITADMHLSGRGTDPYTMQLKADGTISHLQYGSWAFDSISTSAQLDRGHVLATIDSRNALLNGLFDVDARLQADSLNGTVVAHLQHADLWRLGITEQPLTVGMDAELALKSDLGKTHRLQAIIDNLQMHDDSGARSLAKIGALVKTWPDSTVVRMQSGDLIAKLDASAGYDQLLSSLTQIADSTMAQWRSRTIDQLAIRKLLPMATLHIESQQGNPIADVLRRQMNISFKSLNLNLTTSPQTGVNGEGKLLALNYDSTLIDTIRIKLLEKSHGLTINGQVTNNRRNPQMVFNLLFDGFLEEHGAMLGLRYFDEKGRMGIRIGAKGEMVADGLRFQLMPARPTLGYKEYAVKGENMLIMHDNLKLEADIDLEADDGTRLRVYSPEEQDSTLLQDLTVSAHRVDLGELTSSVALLPKIQGVLEGDYHLTMDAQKNISVASDMVIEQLAYEGSPIGNLGSEFVYMNREDGSHAIEAELLLDDIPFGTLSGSYLTNSTLDATLQLSRMPLSIANGFIPDQLIGFEGFANGKLSLKGKMNALETDGYMALTDGYLVSEPYGLSMRFPTDTVAISHSTMTLQDFRLYAYNENPLTVNGTINLSKMDVNLQLMARNMQLINAKQKKQSVAYGKMFVNCFARLTSEKEMMHLRGRLDVLGTTDLNYILLDSPLSTDNQMDELVHFTDFSDTTATVRVQRPTPDGFNMELTLNIDQGTHVHCALNADQTNYVDLLGGGDLRMRMGTDDLTLRGRYTIQSGTMKYSMPIIPLKTFTIHEGSYVEFTGNPTNPMLSLTATERSRATVSGDDSQTRSVIFDCGVVITQTLENMGLQFIIDAPEDVQVQGELASMGSEQRGKLAVTMLTTGMYLADGNTSGFSMNSALSSFLQSEINNITSGALKTVNLEVGLDNTTDASGQSRTDYSFSFAKRFWNNRLSVQIGGKVSTGSEVQGQQQSFFDNVTMEYRLSPTSNQYLKLFYKQNVYDWLDGYTGEYGGGFVWRRKLDRLIDIFRFAPQPTPNPTLRQNGLIGPRAFPITTQTNDSIKTNE